MESFRSTCRRLPPDPNTNCDPRWNSGTTWKEKLTSRSLRWALRPHILRIEFDITLSIASHFHHFFPPSTGYETFAFHLSAHVFFPSPFTLHPRSHNAPRLTAISTRKQKSSSYCDAQRVYSSAREADTYFYSPQTRNNFSWIKIILTLPIQTANLYFCVSPVIIFFNEYGRAENTTRKQRVPPMKQHAICSPIGPKRQWWVFFFAPRRFQLPFKITFFFTSSFRTAVHCAITVQE